MNRERLQKHSFLLAQLLKNLIASRYKEMARAEVLSKFFSSQRDPVFFVDFHLQVERDSIQLTELSLLELVTSQQLWTELERTSLRLQKVFQEVYGEELVPEMSSPTLIEKRARSLKARIEFYNSFLSCSVEANAILELARASFADEQKFHKKLNTILEADEAFWRELERSAAPLHRFMIKKQVQYEIESSKKAWMDFSAEAFYKPPQLS